MRIPSLSPTNPVGFMFLLVQARMTETRRSERGVSTVEWVLISALLVGIAIAVSAILWNALVNKANEVDSELN